MKEAMATGGAARPQNCALEIKRLEKVFGSKGVTTHALAGVDLSVPAGEFLAVMGPSGSGKSTLLNCIATIERATAGQIVVAGRDVTRLKGRELTRFRRDGLGFIFQDSNLLDTLTARENIALALSIKGAAARAIPAKTEYVAQQLGVGDVLDKFPAQMSGGQRQRVAAARAIVTDPTLVLADEPTGALDSRNARVMMDCLTQLNTQMGATIVMVTHDAFAASFASRVVFVRDGRIFNEVRAGEAGRQEMYDRIMRVQAFLGGEARNDA